jgi:fatty acid desaturase
MRLFRYREDRLPVLLFCLLFAVDLAVYFHVDNLWLLLLWFGVGILPKACVCAYNHHHQHVPTFERPWMNRLLEVIYGLQTGVPGHAWVLHHSLGHHVNYLDQQKDESRWRRDDGSIMREFEYATVLAVTAFPRAFVVGRRYPKAQRIFVAMGLVTLSLSLLAIWHRPLPGLIVFGLAPAFSLWGTAWATYVHHAGRSTDSDFVACTNVLQPLYNRCTGNLGYHTAHHHKAGVHWSRLPALHEEIKHLIPADAYVAPGFPWYLAGTGLPPPVLAAVKDPAPDRLADAA